MNQHPLNPNDNNRQSPSEALRMAILGEISAGVAHDFSNILTGIILSSELLLDSKNLPPEVTAQFDAILQNARRGAELVQRMLDFSRLKPPRLEKVHLNSYIGSEHSRWRKQLPRGTSLTVASYGGSMIIRACPASLFLLFETMLKLITRLAPAQNEIYLNLTREHYHPGNLPPEIGMESGDWIRIEIANSRAALFTNRLNHLIDASLFRVTTDFSESIAIARAYRIIRDHWGYVHVDSDAHHHYRLNLYFPQWNDKEIQTDEPACAEPACEQQTILLVEDDKTIRHLGQQALEFHGFRVISATNGREALLAAGDTTRIDFVVTDLLMPEIDGITLMRELRKRNPRLAGIAITGFLYFSQTQALDDVGILDVIEKPFSLDNLIHKIHHHLLTPVSSDPASSEEG